MEKPMYIVMYIIKPPPEPCHFLANAVTCSVTSDIHFLLTDVNATPSEKACMQFCPHHVEAPKLDAMSQKIHHHAMLIKRQHLTTFINEVCSQTHTATNEVKPHAWMDVSRNDKYKT